MMNNMNGAPMGQPGMMQPSPMGGPGMMPRQDMPPGMGMGGPGMGMGGPGMGMPQGQGYGAPGMGMGGMPMGVQNPNQLAAMAPKFTLQQMMMSMSGIFIKQKFEFMEAVTGCESQNKYYVYERDANGNRKGTKLLKCKESSGCCSRLCLPGDCRPFKMKCKNLHNNEVECVQMIRETQCTFLCLNRPQMKVVYLENGKEEYFGKVVDNFDCCNFSFSVKDQNHDTIYHIEADCCQWGIHCKCPCEKCEKIVFDIYSGDKTQKLPVPLMKVGKKDCLKNMMGDADDFSVPFPANASFRDRVLLMAAALLIDYRMFEESQTQGEGRRH